MNSRQLIREFRRSARSAGKSVDVSGTRGALYVTCGERRIKLSCHNREIRHSTQHFQRLGL